MGWLGDGSHAQRAGSPCLNGGGTAAAVPPARRKDGSNRSVKCTAASCGFLLSGHLQCWYYTQSQNHKIWTEATQWPTHAHHNNSDTHWHPGHINYMHRAQRVTTCYQRISELRRTRGAVWRSRILPIAQQSTDGGWCRETQRDR